MKKLVSLNAIKQNPDSRRPNIMQGSRSGVNHVHAINIITQKANAEWHKENTMLKARMTE